LTSTANFSSTTQLSTTDPLAGITDKEQIRSILQTEYAQTYPSFTPETGYSFLSSVHGGEYLDMFSSEITAMTDGDAKPIGFLVVPLQPTDALIEKLTEAYLSSTSRPGLLSNLDALSIQRFLQTYQNGQYAWVPAAAFLSSSYYSGLAAQQASSVLSVSAYVNSIKGNSLAAISSVRSVESVSAYTASVEAQSSAAAYTEASVSALSVSTASAGTYSQSAYNYSQSVYAYNASISEVLSESEASVVSVSTLAFSSEVHQSLLSVVSVSALSAASVQTVSIASAASASAAAASFSAFTYSTANNQAPPPFTTTIANVVYYESPYLDANGRVLTANSTLTVLQNANGEGGYAGAYGAPPAGGLSPITSYVTNVVDQVIYRVQFVLQNGQTMSSHTSKIGMMVPVTTSYFVNGVSVPTVTYQSSLFPDLQFQMVI
jgi:hypothetical protein